MANDPDPSLWNKIASLRLLFEIVGGIGTVITIIGWIISWPTPVLYIGGAVAFTLLSVGIIGQVAASSEQRIVALGKLWDESEILHKQLPSTLSRKKRKITATHQAEEISPKATTRTEERYSLGGHVSLFGLPPKVFPYLPPRYVLAVKIECHIEIRQDQQFLIVRIPAGLDSKTTANCCRFVLDQFDELVAGVLADIKADPLRALALKGKTIAPTLIALYHDSPLGRDDYGHLFSEAGKKGLSLFERHGTLL